MVPRLHLVVFYCFIQVQFLPTAILATDSAIEFEMEVQRKMAAAQISSAREKHGVCNRYELTYWDQLVEQYSSHGMYKEAETTYYQLFQDCVEYKTINHPDTLAVAATLVRFYHNQSQPENVEKFNATLIESAEHKLGRNDLGLIPILDHLSRYYIQTGEKDKSEAILKRTLQITEKSNHSTRLDVAKRQLLLAEMYFSQERFAEAEPLFQTATPVIFAEHARFDEAVIETRRRIIKSSFALGKWSEAETHMNELLVFISQQYGDSHPAFAEHLGYMAIIYANQGRLIDANSLLQRAIKATEAGGEESANLLVNLQKYREGLLELTIGPLEKCTTAQSELLYEKTIIWNDILDSVRAKAENLKTTIEEDDEYADEYARKGSKDKKQFLSYLGYQSSQWGNSTLAKVCLAELAEYNPEIERYMAQAHSLREQWDKLLELCNDQGNEELASQARSFRAHFNDALMNVDMLKDDLLKPLFEDCTNRKKLDDEIELLLEEEGFYE